MQTANPPGSCRAVTRRGRLPVDTELLLTTAPASLERLAGELAPRGAPALALRAVYFDTPDLALGRAGVALVMRRDDRGCTQSIRYALPSRAGLNAWRRTDTPVATDTPDVGALRPVHGADIPDIDDLPLHEVFRVECLRRVIPVTPSPGIRVDVSLSTGSITAAGSVEPLTEVRLTLRAGPPAALYELALTLDRRVPLWLERRTRLERGLALARGGRRVPVRVPLPRVAPLMTSAEAFRAICFACLDHLNANRDGLLADEDPEYLHQMRVALRRLGSAFKVFSRLLPPHVLQPPLGDIRWLTQSLGPLRDCDVFAETCLTPLASQLHGHRGLHAMQRACAKRRERLQRDAARAVRSRRYQRFVLGLSAWLASDAWQTLVDADTARALRQPAERYARAALGRRHARVLQRGRGLSHLGAAKLHRLRVATKKLRYAAGFFAELDAGEGGGQRARRLLAVLEDLQDALGGMNDCAVADRMIRELRATAPRGAMLDDAVELLTSWNAAALARHRERLRVAWKALRATERFWGRRRGRESTHAPDSVATRGSRRRVARPGAPADRAGTAPGEEDGRLARGRAAPGLPRRGQRGAPRARNRPRAHGRV